jgi:hypothetical protein
MFKTKDKTAVHNPVSHNIIIARKQIEDVTMFVIIVLYLKQELLQRFGSWFCLHFPDLISATVIHKAAAVSTLFKLKMEAWRRPHIYIHSVFRCCQHDFWYTLNQTYLQVPTFLRRRGSFSGRGRQIKISIGLHCLTYSSRIRWVRPTCDSHFCRGYWKQAELIPVNGIVLHNQSSETI